ncbi:MAG: outer membrane beta-barrel protein [Bacteroidota bacterium]
MKALIFMLGLLCSYLGYSQQMFVELGTSVTSFDYKNAQGQTRDNLLSKPGVNVAMGYRDDIMRERLFLRIGAVYNSYGAIGSDRRLDNLFEWEVNYLGAGVGLDYRLFGLRDFSFFLKGSASIEFLVRGTQTVNNQVFNLVGEDEFNNSIFFARGGLEMQYPISRNTRLSVNYSYGRTTLLKNNNDDETLNFLAHQFTVGLVISLPNCNCALQL